LYFFEFFKKKSFKYKILIFSPHKHLLASFCFEPLFVTTGLDYEESDGNIRVMAAILDAILNFAKCLNVTKGRFWKWIT